jgi:hypothetical protein
MVLPKGLSVEERKEWHFMSSVQGLRTFSRGLGTDRRLFIGLGTLEDPSGKWAQPDRAVVEKARELHSMLESHGGHNQYSYGELCELVASNTRLPPEILDFLATR